LKLSSGTPAFLKVIHLYTAMSSSSIPGRNRGREKHVALRQEDPLGSWGFLDSRPNSMVKKTGPPKAARFQSLEEQYDIYI
jgi:hypothetical protein